ncbi:sensor histidine kinase [Paenibacillus filicis]|uniref:histidine kinase n=1 Tax=Paenibacillus filicis TaxID=669464 RepID=A0ABU9DJS6_9BACL
MLRMRMNWKITLLSFGIVLFAISIGAVILLGRVLHMQEEGLGQRLLVTARTVAGLPSISAALEDPAHHGDIQPTAERIRIINDVDYIVVMDMAMVRWSHPSEARIGERSHGEDEHSAFAEHTYLSKAKGEKGTALRAFVPVMNEAHDQVGVVLVGQMVPSLRDVIGELGGQMYVTLFLSLLFGVWGSWMLSRHIKEQMFRLEPDEIAQLLVERTATFNAMHEGVIAIDSRERVTVFNDKAKSMLHIQGEVLGRQIREVLPSTRLPEILALDHGVYNEELHMGPVIIMSNRVPIKVRNTTVGAVAIFQDRTEVTRIAEELTGVKAFIDALRVQNHEHMNKLHTIGGLIQLDHKQKALDYLFQTIEDRSEQNSFIASKIADESVAGLLLGKISRGRELGIEVRLDPESRMKRFPERFDPHDMVIILGNLVENAFDALMSREGHREIFISIAQDEELLSILVEDNGSGMSAEAKRRMLERGFSTKTGPHQGIGLFLIGQIVHKCGGTLDVESEPGAGTSFILTFPMSESESEEGGHVSSRTD